MNFFITSGSLTHQLRKLFYGHALMYLEGFFPGSGYGRRALLLFLKPVSAPFASPVLPLLLLHLPYGLKGPLHAGPGLELLNLVGPYLLYVLLGELLLDDLLEEHNGLGGLRRRNGLFWLGLRRRRNFLYSSFFWRGCRLFFFLEGLRLRRRGGGRDWFFPF